MWYAEGMKSKRTFFTALCLICLLLCPLFSRGEEAYIPISTRQELEAIAQNPGGKYRLEADIDLGGAPWTPIAFFGELDGGGHTLLNLYVDTPGTDRRTTIDGNRKKYDTVFAALFSVAEKAFIHDLTLLNAKTVLTTEENCFIAALCGYAKDCTFENVAVSCRNTLNCASVNEGVGGLMGFCYESTVTACTVNAELVFTDTNREVDCESFLGGIYAGGCGRIFDSAVTLRGYASIYGYAHSGGFVGMCKLLSTEFSPRLRNCTSDTIITFFECAPARRAYCDPYIGEDCGKNCYMSGNTTVQFEGREVRQYDIPLLPEMCADPAYREEETLYSCAAMGYTTYTCTSCGYSYTDAYHLPDHRYEAAITAPTCTEEGYTTYTCPGCMDSYVSDQIPPTHTPGAWETETPAQEGLEGKEVKKCLVCGEVLEERTLEPLPTQPPASPAPTSVPEEEAPKKKSWWETLVYYLFFGWIFQ